MTTLLKEALDYSNQKFEAKSSTELKVVQREAAGMHLTSNANDNKTAISISMNKIIDALDKQLVEARAFETNTERLKTAIIELSQLTEDYSKSLEKINFAPLRRKSLRLAAIMDSAL